MNNIERAACSSAKPCADRRTDTVYGLSVRSMSKLFAERLTYADVHTIKHWFVVSHRATYGFADWLTDLVTSHIECNALCTSPQPNYRSSVLAEWCGIKHPCLLATAAGGGGGHSWLRCTCELNDIDRLISRSSASHYTTAWLVQEFSLYQTVDSSS